MGLEMAMSSAMYRKYCEQQNNNGFVVIRDIRPQGSTRKVAEHVQDILQAAGVGVGSSSS